MSTAIARNLMAEMKLGGMLAAFDKTVTDATRDQLGYSEFLDVLLQAEADYRGERVAQRRLKAAKLPTRVSLDDFDYTAQRSITINRGGRQVGKDRNQVVDVAIGLLHPPLLASVNPDVFKIALGGGG